MLLCAVFAVLQVTAQTRSIRGKVVDEKNNPIANASVLVKGTTTGTTTGADGGFTIGVPSTARVLVISSLGFARQEVILTSGSSYSVTLKASTDALEEVVVTGYSREKRSQFVGAATVISSKAVETVPVGSFDQALQGRAPGMLVNSGSGQPGTSPTIRIRGVQSITGAGAQPLYVIDGVPAPDGLFQTLNPNDFESITVLKDASAAAMYGSRGGTGVIVITTKRGKAGATKFQYRGQVGFTQRPNFDRMNLMNTAEMLAYEERERLAGTPGWVWSPLNPAIPAGMTAATKQAALDSIRRIDIDYADLFYRQGMTQSHEINMTGGSGQTRYYLSASYFDQEGIDLGSKLTRYTTRFNMDYNADKFTVTLNSSIGFSKGRYSEGEQLGNSPLNPFQMTYRAKTYENPYNPDGTLRFGASSSLALRQVANLLERIQNTSLQRNQIKVNGGLTFSYKILPYLTAKTVFGVDVTSDQSSRYINPNSYVGSLQSFQRGAASEGYRLISQFINTSSLTFSKRFADVHEVEVAGFFEAIREYNKTLGFTLFNLDTRLTETGQGAGALPVAAGQTTYPQNASSAKSTAGIRSFFATARYTFDNKYTLTGNIRRDGTSKIVNIDNREITTWAAGFSWNALREKFLENQTIFSDLRARVSYGLVPNIGSIPTGGFGNGVSFGGITNYQGPQLPVFGTANYPGSTVVGQVATSPGNPDLKIEFIKKWNAGIDFAVWANRARFSVDYYHNRTIDLFLTQSLPATSGFPGGQVINAGIMSNKGFEFTAAVDVVRSRDFTANVSLNHSISTNKIEDIGSATEYPLGTFLIRPGLAYGSHYSYNYLGADPATGRPIFETATGGTTNNIAQAGRFAKFGTFLPKHQGGANIELTYKAFTVSAFFSYQFDVVRSNNIRNWITRGTPGYHGAVRASRELIDGQWQKAGDVKPFQSSAFDRDFTSADLEDAKFLRFRNLNLAYQIPAIKLGNGRTIINGGRFYVQAHNLAIWSPWRGLDPEDDNNISLNEYPNPKMFVVGFDINF